MKNIGSDLRARSFSTVGMHRNLTAAIARAMSAWHEFCNLPREDKLRFPYENDPKADGGGYELKTEEKTTFDQKENLHWTFAHSNRLRSLVRPGDAAVLSLLYMSDELMRMMHPLVQDAATQIATEFALGDEFIDEVLEGHESWIIRYLHYFGGRRPNEVIASAHPDKSCFTIYLGETDRGVEYLDDSRRWIEMPVEPGNTRVTTNMQLQLITGGATKALWHRVTANERTAEVGRYSMVFFVPLTKRPTTFKRTQELVPGSTYDMTHEEFAKLFK